MTVSVTDSDDAKWSSGMGLAGTAIAAGDPFSHPQVEA